MEIVKHRRQHKPGAETWIRQGIATLLVLMVLFPLVPQVKADQWGDWTYTTDGSNVTITGYTGTGGGRADAIH